MVHYESLRLNQTPLVLFATPPAFFFCTEPVSSPLMKPPNFSTFPFPCIPLFSSLHFPWSLYTVLVSVVVPCCILTSEHLEVGTSDGREHVMFVSLVLDLPHSIESFLGLFIYLQVLWVFFFLQLNSVLLCICPTF